MYNVHILQPVSCRFLADLSLACFEKRFLGLDRRRGVLGISKGEITKIRIRRVIETYPLKHANLPRILYCGRFLYWHTYQTVFAANISAYQATDSLHPKAFVTLLIVEKLGFPPSERDL